MSIKKGLFVLRHEKGTNFWTDKTLHGSAFRAVYTGLAKPIMFLSGKQYCNLELWQSLHVSASHRVIDQFVIPSPLGDYCLIFCAIKLGVVKAPGRTTEYRSYKRYSKQDFPNELRDINTSARQIQPKW